MRSPLRKFAGHYPPIWEVRAWLLSLLSKISLDGDIGRVRTVGVVIAAIGDDVL
jgi:hypothetical protein